MRTTALACALLFTLTAMCSNAQACSVQRQYRVPNSLELVEQADAIVLARVIDNGPSTSDTFARMGGHEARLVPFQTLKGDRPVRAISFPDAVLELPSAKLHVTPSDPRNLVDANLDSFSGGCNRYAFKKGMIVVAFLKRDGKDFVPFAPPFSRALEDVPSPNALWVKAVRLYVRIAAKPKSMRRQEMRRLRVRLGYDYYDSDSRLLALELDRALKEPKR